jgi:hypothetical protein
MKGMHEACNILVAKTSKEINHLGDMGIEENNIKMNVRNKLLIRAMHWAVSEHGPLAGFGNTMLMLSSIYKREEFLDQLDYYSTGMQRTILIIFIQG